MVNISMSPVCHHQDRSFELGKEKSFAWRGMATENMLLAAFSSLLRVCRLILICDFKVGELNKCMFLLALHCYLENFVM